MAFFFMIAAGLLIALGNLCMRKAIAVGGHARSYILIQIFISALWSLASGALLQGSLAIDAATIVYGLGAGCSLGLFMKFLGVAMSSGPTALTVAFINGSTLFPALFFYLILGSSFGFSYSWQAFAGACLLLSALWWATKQDLMQRKGENKEGTDPTQSISLLGGSKWLMATLSCFSAHIAMLIIISLRALSLEESTPAHPLIVPSTTTHAHLFFPLMFATAWIIQVIEHLRTNSSHVMPSWKEWILGTLGGLANGSSVQLVALGTFFAASWQMPMLFPIYSVAIMTACNLWTSLLYQERVFWPASVLAMLSIFIGSL